MASNKQHSYMHSNPCKTGSNVCTWLFNFRSSTLVIILRYGLNRIGMRWENSTEDYLFDAESNYNYRVNLMHRDVLVQSRCRYDLFRYVEKEYYFCSINWVLTGYMVGLSCWLLTDLRGLIKNIIY